MNNENRGELVGELALAVEAMRMEPPPSDARQRLIDAAASWTPASIAERPRRKVPPVIAVLVAGSLLLTVSVGLYLATLAGRARQVDDGSAQSMTATRDDALPGTTQPLQSESLERLTEGTHALRPEDPARLSRPSESAGTTPCYLNVIVAECAPIMLANGRGEPIELGARMPGLKAADAVVHIWDWSRSPHSRVLKDVELLTAYAALSPCGRWLLKASGDIFDLNTGQRKTIDLGAAVRVGDRWDEGLNDIRFSPDGGRLAVLIGSRTDEGALRGELRIVEFPTGKRLCQFPAGEPYKLRIGFSPDGKQVVTGNPARQILRRDATTGEVITVYEPALDEQVYSATFSPDARFVAATQDEGDLLVWEADTRRLVFKQHGRGEDIDVGCLRFSPDSKFLAAADWSRVTVYDAATGRVVGEIKPRRWSPSPTVVHWSADGEKLTVVNGGPAGTEDGRDIYPSVQEWDWKSGELLQSLDASAPAKDGS